MSSIDPIQRRIMQLSGGGRTPPEESSLVDPVARRILAAQAAAQASEGPGFLARTGEFIGNAAELAAAPVQALFGDEEADARLQAFGTGVVSSAVYEPLQALLQIPGLFTNEEIITDRAAEFIGRATEGLYTRAERRALEAGASINEVADAHSLGNFVGFFAPITASLKGASIALGTGTKLSRFVSTGDLITDFTAGLVFGGLLRPGEELGDRVKHMAEESAMFGITRLIISGTVAPLRVWRRKRALEIQKQNEITSFLDAAESGTTQTLRVPEERGVLQLLQEESYLLQSPAAQDLLRQNAYDTALAQALVDAAGRSNAQAIFRNVGKSYQEAVDRISRFQQQFPGLKFSFPVSRDVGSVQLTQTTFEEVSAAGILDTLESAIHQIDSPTREGFSRIRELVSQYMYLPFRDAGSVSAGEMRQQIGSALSSNRAYREQVQSVLEKLGLGETVTVYKALPHTSDPLRGEFSNASLSFDEAYKYIRKFSGSPDPGSRSVVAIQVPRSEIIGLLPNREVEVIFRSSSARGVRDLSGVKPTGNKQVTSIAQKTYDVYFGTKGISKKQLRQLKVEGRFEGQLVHYGSTEATYVGRGTKDRVKVKRADGKILTVREGNITDLPFVVDELEFTPQWDTLYSSFREWMQSRSSEVVRSRGGLSEAELVAAIREGHLPIGDDTRRIFNQGGAIVHPEEIGVGPNRFGVRKLTGTESADEHAWEIVDTVMGRPVGAVKAIYDPSDGLLFIQDMGAEDIINKLGYTQIKAMGRQVVTDLANEGIPVSGIGGFRPGGRTQSIPAEFFLKSEGREVAETIAREGTERTHLLDPSPVTTFEEVFDEWAKQAGLPREVSDYMAARSSFGDRFRREMWETVPENERRIFDSIIEQQQRYFADEEFPLPVLAHMKGFSIKSVKDGAVTLREVNTGAEFTFGTEGGARSALQQIARVERDIPSILPITGHGMQALTGGLPKTSGTWTFDENIQSLQTSLELPWKWVRNVRDWLIQVEKQTGVPLWSNGFELIDRGKSTMLAEYDPWAKEIHSSWKGIAKSRREKIAEAWVELEQRQLPLNEAVLDLKQRGFNTAEINAYRRSRTMFDKWFEMSGISRERYIEGYYTRIRPWVEANGALDVKRALGDLDVLPAEFNFWAEMARTGDLETLELDPEIVMHKYIRSLLFKKHVKPHWDQVARLTGTRTSPPLKIRDLPPELQAGILRNARPGTTENSAVLPVEIRDVLSEYLTIIRGTPGKSLQTLRGFTARFFNMLGVKADTRVTEEFLNTVMSTMYGSAMGARPSLVARNMSQTLWMLYTRIGPKQIGRGMERAMTQEGFNEAAEAGALRLTEAGVPYGDAIFETMLARSAEADKGPLSQAIAMAVRKGLRLGKVSQNFAQKILIPYSSSDQASRSWSYFAQKLHTDEWLQRFESKAISWEKFEDQGLSFFSEPIRTRFRDLYNYTSREQALRFIGKMGADESNFIYGVGAQPAWMQSAPGRLLGMFGTWPLWAHELYFRRVRYATPSQLARFAVRNLALVGAFTNMGVQAGIDMWSWIAPGSTFGWSGGPALEHVINMKQVIDAPMDQKAGALKRMAQSGLRLSYPGQGFVRDVTTSLDASDPNQAFLSMMLGRPSDAEHWAIVDLYDPDLAPDTSYITPETEASLIVPDFPEPVNYRRVQREPISLTSETGSRLPASFGLIEGNIPAR